jgi:hypothetical protein
MLMYFIGICLNIHCGAMGIVIFITSLFYLYHVFFNFKSIITEMTILTIAVGAMYHFLTTSRCKESKIAFIYMHKTKKLL